jgi:peptide methionine sulfoxide reductase msrA/msrB
LIIFADMKKTFFLGILLLPLVMSAQTTPANLPRAIFAGGCFWCIQPLFDQTPGVISTRVGYTGGHIANPTYEEVCAETTGHREAIEITYDPGKVSYEKLLHVYWRAIDPTDAGGQFYDRGESYTTAIFYTSPEQKTAAEESKAQLEKAFSPQKIATVILPAMPFYPAEDYHQTFYQKCPLRFNSYKSAGGHDEKLRKLWGDKG